MKIFFAFTLIELSLSLAVASMLVVSISIPVVGLMRKSAVDSVSESIITAVQTSQINSINSVDLSAWGVCLVSNVLYVFSGSCDSAGRKQSFILSSLALVSGFSTTSFSNLFGEPSPSNGLSNVVISSGTYSKVLSISSTGGLSVSVN